MITRRILLECPHCGERFHLWGVAKDHLANKHPLDPQEVLELYYDTPAEKEDV